VLNLKRCGANNKKNSTNTAILGTIALSALAVFLYSVGMTEAETGIGSDIFKVVLTIIGADKAKTGDVVAIVTVNDHAKVKFFELKSPNLISNPSNTSEPSTETTDEKIIEYVATFPNVTVNSGDSYNACVLPLKSLKLVCSEGHNSPAKRPEFVDISLGSDKSESSSSSSSSDESTTTNQSAVLSSGFDITDEKQHKKK
jgi:flagellar basal body-associated protein FliL